MWLVCELPHRGTCSRYWRVLQLCCKDSPCSIAPRDKERGWKGIHERLRKERQLRDTWDIGERTRKNHITCISKPFHGTLLSSVPHRVNSTNTQKWSVKWKVTYCIPSLSRGRVVQSTPLTDSGPPPSIWSHCCRTLCTRSDNLSASNYKEFQFHHNICILSTLIKTGISKLGYN